MNMKKDEEHGPGGWCCCEECKKYVKHTFVAPCRDVICRICGKKLKKVK